MARGIGLTRTGRLAVLLTLLLATVPGSAQASEFGKFHTGLAIAYPHYREALFYLRTGNGGVASFELEQWTDKWASLVDQFAAAPPDIYSDDPDWRQHLAAIQELSQQGLTLAREGALKAAGEKLGKVRWLLSDLRKANHVIIFSDHVDAANRAFDKLFKFRHTPPSFDDTEQLDAFRRAVAVTTHTYQQVMERAPAAYLEDEEFQRLMKQSFHSLSRLWVAIAEQNRLNLINILREMRSSDRMLYLRFG